MWNTAETREPQLDSDEGSQASWEAKHCFERMQFLTCLYPVFSAFSSSLFEDVRPWASASLETFIQLSATTKLFVLVPN